MIEARHPTRIFAVVVFLSLATTGTATVHASEQLTPAKIARIDSAIRRPAYTPTPVPSVLTMNAVIVPTRAPSHQPIAPPTLAPRMVRTLDMA